MAVINSWQPTKPTSKGAAAYHDAIINTSWHKKNIDGLIKIIKKHVKDNHLVVDFGAGTGGSAVYLLQKLKGNFSLMLVDNSPSWLGKAYETLYKYPNVKFSIIEKISDKYAMLHESIGEAVADHIVSANTVHLIPNIDEAFTGIYKALKKGGTFTLQSGNIMRKGRESGILMIDNTVNKVHDFAIDNIYSDDNFKKYRKGLMKKIQAENSQRKLVFPDPRPLEYYLQLIKETGFSKEKIFFKKIRVLYKDWLAFLRVKRLQAGILPEIGGRQPSLQEEKDRDTLITKAVYRLFKELEEKNPLANSTSFVTEWVYVNTKKI